jgi:hypothetical protein
MKKKRLLRMLKIIAVAGNFIFALWISYNGMNEGFRGNPVQIASYIGLLVLLTLNSVLLVWKTPSRS